VPKDFPELAAMKIEELTELLTDEAKYVAFVQARAVKAHIIQVGKSHRGYVRIWWSGPCQCLM
jgi:hypothetical protein